MALIATSILGIKDNLNEIKKINDTDTDYIHLDIMDGEFVNNKTYNFNEIERINKVISKSKDVHLMVSHPITYIKDYISIKPDIITFHLEALDDIDEAINLIKSEGIKVGISLKPKTPVVEIYPYLDKIDLVLIMSVEPGYGGQPFIEKSLSKIKELKEYISAKYYPVLIEVDGGINNITGKLCSQAGADIIVAGSFVTNNSNYQNQINKLR